MAHIMLFVLFCIVLSFFLSYSLFIAVDTLVEIQAD